MGAEEICENSENLQSLKENNNAVQSILEQSLNESVQ